jgi:putative salt-induced outer membrane protein YdiY
VNLKTVFLCFILLLGTPLYGRPKTDVIIMRNGDRLTCEIKSLDSDVLYVSLDYVLGTISVNWSQVDHIESKQLFLVKTEDGSVYSGMISTPDSTGARPTKIEVWEPPEEKVELERVDVIRMEPTARNFWERFNGEIGLGATYNKGNNTAQYNLNADANYPQERWSASASYNSTLSSSEGTSPASRNEIEIGAQRLLPWNNWYYTGAADFLQSSVQGIQLQSTLGGGIGRYLKNSNRASISVDGGLAWQRINYQESILPSTTQQSVSALIGAKVYLFVFDKTTLTINTSVLPSFSDPGRVHFNLNTSYYIKLWRKLTWNISFYGNWDNRPPPGFSASDYGTSIGVTWKFGNR